MNRRLSRRFLCAELVEVRWKDKSGRLHFYVANLEDISRSGACLLMEAALPLETEVVIRSEGLDVHATVRYCLDRDDSHFLGVAFAEGTQWSRMQYRPQHLLDPRELVLRTRRRLREEGLPSA
jgi:hypothetical protein